MPTVPLTDQFVKAVESPTRTSYYDEKLPGLILRVTPNGVKTWAIWYRDSGGRAHLITLGRYPVMTLATAREVARPLLVKARLGVLHSLLHDVAQRGNLTLGELAQRYLDEYAKLHKKSWKYDEDVIKGPLTPLLNEGAHSLTRQTCKTWFNDLTAGGPVWANRSLSVLRRIFNWGIEESIVNHNPAARIRPNRETSRHRILSQDELRRVWPVMVAEGSAAGQALCMMLITAQRKSEVLSMRYEDVEVTVAPPSWWTIPNTKNGLPHRVPLFPLALDSMARMAKYSLQGVWVFEAERESESPHITNPMKAVARIKQLSGTSGWTPHDLRRTAASGMASLGTSSRVLAAVLNHQEPGVTAIYDRHTYDAEKAEALKAWNDHLTAIAS